MFVKNSEKIAFKDVAITTIKRGIGGRYCNKVCCVVILESITNDAGRNCCTNCDRRFVNLLHQLSFCSWAAPCPAAERRCGCDVRRESLAYVGGDGGSMVFDHEIVFVRLNGLPGRISDHLIISLAKR